MPHFIEKADPAHTAVIVVDMTNDFVAPGSDDFSDDAYIEAGRILAPALDAFLDRCREKGFRQIIYISHGFREDCRDMHYASRAVMGIAPAGEMEPPSPILTEDTWGTEVYEVCAPKEGEILVKKHHYSAFDHTELDIILRANEIRTVVITGCCTDTCCHATSFDAFCLGYDVVVLSDLTGTRGAGEVSAEDTHIAALNGLFANCADVMDSKHFLETAE